MKRKKHILVAALLLAHLSGCATSPLAKFGRGSICFSNCSTQDLYVDRVLCDGKEFGVACGVLGPNGSATIGFMFPHPFPKEFTLEYEKEGTPMVSSIDTTAAWSAIVSAAPAREITLHFVYSHQGVFVLKVHFDRGGENLKHEGELWPDETNAQFLAYQDLVRYAYEGNAPGIKRLMDAGTPFAWPDDPISLTPLEWTARWNHMKAFEVLFPYIPNDYSLWDYANCIKLAAQDDNKEILEDILQNPKVKQIPPHLIRNVFYSTCQSAKDTATLELLLKHLTCPADFHPCGYGTDLLIKAAQEDNLRIARWLVSQGVITDKSNQDGQTPLKCAQSEEMKALLRKK